MDRKETFIAASLLAKVSHFHFFLRCLEYIKCKIISSAIFHERERSKKKEENKSNTEQEQEHCVARLQKGDFVAHF